MRIIVIVAGLVIWIIAGTHDTVLNGADLLGAALTLGGAFALLSKTQNKENESDQ